MADVSAAPRRFAHSRWPAYVVGLGAVVAAALPALRSAQLDAFPLSTYPMFARSLDKPQVSFVERVDAKGRTRRLGTEHLGSDEVMQAYRTVKLAVRKGPKAAEALCRTLAKRVSNHERGKHDVQLRIVRARFDPVAYFVDDAEPEEREIIASCKAGRNR
jgi:hypothetical protein